MFPSVIGALSGVTHSICSCFPKKLCSEDLLWRLEPPWDTKLLSGYDSPVFLPQAEAETCLAIVPCLTSVLFHFLSPSLSEEFLLNDVNST